MCNILKLFGKQGFYSKNMFPSVTQCCTIWKHEVPWSWKNSGVFSASQAYTAFPGRAEL